MTEPMLGIDELLPIGVGVTALLSLVVGLYNQRNLEADARDTRSSLEAMLVAAGMPEDLVGVSADLLIVHERSVPIFDRKLAQRTTDGQGAEIFLEDHTEADIRNYMVKGVVSSIPQQDIDDLDRQCQLALDLISLALIFYNVVPRPQQRLYRAVIVALKTWIDNSPRRNYEVLVPEIGDVFDERFLTRSDQDAGGKTLRAVHSACLHLDGEVTMKAIVTT